MKKRFLDMITLSAVPLLVSVLIRVLGRTLRYRTVNRERAEGVRSQRKALIYALWHGRMLPLIYMYRNRKAHVLVSHHRDGEVASRAARRFGYCTVRGSSTRGGAKGFQTLLRKVSAGFDAAIMPDGPHGPPHQVQPGIIHLAQLSQCPIIPVSMGVSRRITLNSWDGFIIPKPFSRCVVVYGDPIFVPSDASPAVLEEKKIELEQSLNRISQEADSSFD